MAAIIFDFDGTIADSFDYVASYLAAEAKGSKPTPEELAELRGLSMVAMARQLGHPWWRLPRLFIQGRHRMRRFISRLEPFAGMPEIIKKLHAEGHELFIVTSNSVHNVHAFLHRHGLQRYFLTVYGGISLFGKAPALRRLLKEQGIEAKDSLYVGDELRDIEAARAVGIRPVAVGWGFARTADIIDMKPAALVSSPDELLQVLEEG